jgi:flavin-dependent dehydrogenase
MKVFDVIIVGGGPAGLRCAEILSGSPLSVLLVEKNTDTGAKVCAGGITRKDIEILHLPEKVIGRKVTHTAIFSKYNRSMTETGSPFVFTIDRKELSAWQRSLLGSKNVTLLDGSRVTKVEADRVTLDDHEVIGFRNLVGADGYASVVRRFLGIPVERRLIGIQYRVPINGRLPRLEMHLHPRYFHSWYGWVFPHRDTLGVGFCLDPAKVSITRYAKRFERWMESRNIELTGAVYESAPISYDYRGFQFGNIFLAGDAGGFASGLTGEGIYQALVSGEAAARRILDPEHISEPLKTVIRYNSIQRKIMNVFYYAGPLRYLIHEVLLLLLNFGPIKKRLHRSFTATNSGYIL